MPISRILYPLEDLFPGHADDSHLSVFSVAREIKRHFRISADTALHPGKDFAVSLRVLPRGLAPLGAPSSFEERRLCSHLSRLGRGRALPATLLPARNTGECSDFPPAFRFRNASDCPA